MTNCSAILGCWWLIAQFIKLCAPTHSLLVRLRGKEVDKIATLSLHGACPECHEILPLHFVQGQNDNGEVVAE